MFPSNDFIGVLSNVIFLCNTSFLDKLSTDFPFGKNFLICLLMFSTLGFWLDTYGSQKNSLHLSSPVILEKQMPSMSVKQGSLSVKITGINSMKLFVPIFSSNSSKYLTILFELGLVIISNRVKWTSGKINDKMFLLSVFMAPRKSNCHTFTLGFLWMNDR